MLRALLMAITSTFQADDAGSIPAARSNSFLCADIAQSVERTLGKGEVLVRLWVLAPV